MNSTVAHCKVLYTRYKDNNEQTLKTFCAFNDDVHKLMSNISNFKLQKYKKAFKSTKLIKCPQKILSIK